MAVLTRKEKAANNLQLFRGGFDDLDPITKARLKSNGCCGNPIEVDIDRLPARMRPNNDLTHTTPTGNRETRIVAGAGSRVANEIAEHFVAVGEGASVSMFALPDYSVLKYVAVSLRKLPQDMALLLHFRNSDVTKVFDTSLFHVVTVAGSACDPVREYEYDTFLGSAINPDGIPLQVAGEDFLCTNYVLQLDTSKTFMPMADELILTVQGYTDEITAADFDFTISINYDVTVRAEY